MSYHANQTIKHCTKCGCVIPAGMKYCSKCGAPVVSKSSQSQKPQQTNQGTTPSKSTPLCAVCGKSAATNPCPRCGFDSSRDYEHYPTIQHLPQTARPISHLKKKLRPSAATAVDMLRKQGWDSHVLNAVQKVLSQAENGTFTPQHYVEIRKQGWDNQVVNTVHKVLNQTESVIFPQHAQKSKIPPVPTAVPKVPFVSNIICPVCGASNIPSRLYCVDCGVKLPTTPSTATPPVPTATPQAPVVSSKVCPVCGASNDPNQQICLICGAKLHSTVNQ